MKPVRLGDPCFYRLADGPMLAAIVTHVWEDGRVNVAVFAEGGDAMFGIRKTRVRYAGEEMHGEYVLPRHEPSEVERQLHPERTSTMTQAMVGKKKA